MAMIKPDSALALELAERAHQCQHLFLGADSVYPDEALVYQGVEALVKGFHKRVVRYPIKLDHNELRPAYRAKWPRVSPICDTDIRQVFQAEALTAALANKPPRSYSDFNHHLPAGIDIGMPQDRGITQ